MPANNVYVAGVAMTPFLKPSETEPYEKMGAKAIEKVLLDAGLLEYNLIQQVYAGYVYGDSCAGQRVAYEVGMTGVPIVNVNNNCSTGSTALYLARQAVESGQYDCVLAVGFEQMTPGALSSAFHDRSNPLDRFVETMTETQGRTDSPMAAQLFGGAGRLHMEKYGTKAETFAQISVKARQHAAKNPNAVFRELLSLEDVLSSPEIFHPLTRFQCCPPTCGAAAAIVCSESFATKHGLNKSVRIVAQSMKTDYESTFSEKNMMKVVGYEMAQKAAAEVYEKAAIGPGDVNVVELHDCFTANELITYESLGLTPEGTAEKFIMDGDNTYGGRYVVNPSGGLLSKGHPLGATGLAQCAELVWQLRGEADARQVEGARIALQHNVGVGGACVVTLYQAV